MEKAWTEMHVGSDIIIPRIYRFIIKYITPAFLLFILGFWFWQDWTSIILMKNVPKENIPFVLGTRIGIVIFFGVLAFLVRHIWQKREQRLKEGMQADAF
jgi:nitrate reductase gamma subunit